MKTDEVAQMNRQEGQAYWLIERSQPEGQDPPYWWTGRDWSNSPFRAMRHPTQIRAMETLHLINGIEGVHSPMGHVVAHVFVGEPPDYADLLNVAKMVLARLDAEARERGETLPFVCNALRPALRAAIARAGG